MTDPNEPKNINFSVCDQPELHEIDQQAVRQERKRREMEQEETRMWLQENMGFKPFGYEW